MGKNKSKGQKKKFFSHPKNIGKVFKRKEAEVPTEVAGNVLRQRGEFAVLSAEEYGITEIPQCSHGPCLLFGQRTGGNITSRFFACAVYRNSPEHCAYKAEMLEDGSMGKIEHAPRPQRERPWHYGCIPKKLKAFEKDADLVFCRECTDVFDGKHRCPSEVVKRAHLRTPSKYLEPLDNQAAEAQYFFSEESLNVMLSIIDRSKCDGVLCIGAPRIFESLKLSKSTKKIFMLDIDRRYAHFYPSKQYAQYSMLVDHFFDNKSEAKLYNFFKECSSMLIICDPPFGVYTDPLMLSLKKMEKRFASVSENGVLNLCVIAPFFIGKHILRTDKRYYMSDYRVMYSDHKLYSKRNRTPVRIFTTVNSSVIDLTDVPGYKFCEMCEKYVSEDNKHCFMCQACTSKDGGAYKHCERCMRCVKISYKHCKECEHCHLAGRCRPKKDSHRAETEMDDE